MSFVGDVQNLTAAIKGLKGEINGVFSLVKKLTPEARGTIKDLTAMVKAGGQIGLGEGSKIKLGVDDAKFAAKRTGGSMMPDSLASSQTQVNNYRMSYMPYMTPGLATAKMIGGVAQMGAGVLAGGYAALPDLGTTVSRATNYYGSAVRFGGVNLQQFQRQTMTALRGGITGLGDDAAAAAQLVQGYNYMPGSAAFTQTMREVGGAALALNMSNPSAAAAIGGFQTGPMGANLYQYGIAQFDAKGNPLSQSQIARQLFNRIFPNQKGLTAKDVQMSLQYGLAGADLQTMGFSQDQINLLQYQFGQFAAGKNADLAKVKNDPNNPMNAAYQINTSQTDLMQRAQAPMIKGFQDAANAVTAFNKSLEGLPDQIYQLKGAIQGVSGTNMGSGIGAFLGGLGSGIGSFAGGFLGARALGMGTKEIAGMVGKTALKGIGKLGVATAGVAASQTLGNVAGKGASKGSLRSRLAKAGKYGGTVGFGTLAIPGLGETIIPELVTGTLASIYGFATGGGTPGFGAAFNATSNVDTSTAMSPIPGVQPVQNFGAKDSSTWKNKHTGLDYPAPMGTVVVSLSDGVVAQSNMGSDYGVHVVIDDGHGMQYIYAHLSQKSVQPGDKVSKNQRIGNVGDTGNADGPHLHLEVRKGKNNPVDPNTILGNGQLGIVSGQVQQTYGTILGTGDQQDWARKFLTKINKPVTSDNLKAITTWMAYEGGHWKNTAHYNPLNTTQPSSGATNMNSVGVKSYQSWDQGFQATVDTINNGRYGNILKALSAGNNANAVISAINKSPWGTHIPTAKGGGNPGFGTSMPSLNSGSGIVNNFSIQVQVQSASEEEATRFAKRVQALIDERSYINTAGSK